MLGREGERERESGREGAGSSIRDAILCAASNLVWREERERARARERESERERGCVCVCVCVSRCLIINVDTVNIDTSQV
jgi:hypothetical protein